MPTTSERAASQPIRPHRPARTDGRARWRRRAWLGGGPDGNEQLTTSTGVILILLLAVLGVTILRVQQLISLHLFLGLLLLGPVAVKMASTGYRFARYYTHGEAYRRKGPPELWLRLIAPVVVMSTVIVFASGVVLLFDGPARRGAWVGIHKASFIVWLVFTGLHVLGHLGQLPASLRAVRAGTGRRGSSAAAASSAGLGSPAGGAGRWLTIVGALVGGVVLAIVLMPEFASWTAHGAFVHQHH